MRLVELLLDVSLHLGVDRGDQRVPGGRLDLAGVAQHAAHGVDRHLLVAGLAAQALVVGLLDAGPADDRGAVDRGVVVLVRLVELALGDRAEVAEHVGRVDAVRRGVGAHALLLRQHAGVVLGLLEHLDRDLLRDVAGHRHRLVGRAVPAGARLGPGLAAEQHPRLDLGSGTCATRASLRSVRARTSSGSLPTSVRSTLITQLLRLATSGRPMSSTIRPRAGCTTTSRTDCSAAWAW